MTGENPFRDFWQQLRGRGQKIDRFLTQSLYRVELTNEEVTSLCKLSGDHPEIKAVVYQTTGNEVDFFAKEAINLSKKSWLKPRR